MRFKTFLEEVDREKKLVLLVDDYKGMSELFKKHINKLCSDNLIELIPCEVDTAKVSQNKLTCGGKTYNIDNKNTVFNIRTPKGIELAEQLEGYGFSVFNNPKKLALCTDKWESQKFLEKNNIPCPKTFKVKTEEELESASKKIKSFPQVMKILGGAGGKGVQKCDSYDSLLVACQTVWAVYKDEELKEQPLLIQEYLDGDFDVRVNVYDGIMVDCSKRQSKNFRNNLSQDGKSEKYKISAKEKEMCENIARKLKTEIMGVDLMYNGKDCYVLEINTSGIAVNKEALGNAFIKIVKRKLDECGSD